MYANKCWAQDWDKVVVFLVEIVLQHVVSKDIGRMVKSAPSSPRKHHGLIGRIFSSTAKSALNDEEFEANRKRITDETDIKSVQKRALEILEEHRTYKARLCDALRTQHALENEVHSLGKMITFSCQALPKDHH